MRTLIALWATGAVLVVPFAFAFVTAPSPAAVLVADAVFAALLGPAGWSLGHYIHDRAAEAAS